MKKNIFIICAAALALASCTQNDTEPAMVQNPDAISFRAYAGETITRGVAIANDEIIGSSKPGIGVFAFYQPAVNGVKVDFNTRKFATPDFMYNQQVTSDDSGDNWTYTPTKYWPNNTGDQLSFFAYAPYDEDMTWDDLGVATDATASKLTASFPIYNEKGAMQDILWTDPQLNKTKASTTSGATDNPIIFEFKHILSKVAIQVGVESDQAAGQAGAWDYDNTDITINSIEFKGLAESYNFSKTIASTPVTTWSATGSQDIKLTEDDFRNNVITADNHGATTAGVWNSAYWNSLTSPTYYKTLLAQEDNDDAFLFFAPQTFTAGANDLVITYTVLTKENWNTTTLGANDSKIVNTIECSLADILPLIGASQTDHGFETGKAYTLKFLIGMNSVKVTSTVGTWYESDANQIDVPANEAISINVQAATGAGCTFSDIHEDDANLYLTVNRTEEFDKIYYKKSAGTEYFTDSTLIDLTETVNSYTVTLSKSALGDTTKAIFVNTIKTPSIDLVSYQDGVTITNKYEYAGYVYFTVNRADGFHHVYYRTSAAGEDNEINPQPTVNVQKHNVKIAKSALGDAANIYVTVVSTITVNPTDCTLAGDVTDEESTLTFDITDNGTKTLLTLKGNGNTLLEKTTSEEEGKYAESISNSTHTITYYKKSSNDYTSIDITANRPCILTGEFSVSENKKVKFTMGNLYWDGSAFQIEENQTDYPTAWSTSHVGHFTWQKTAAASYIASFNYNSPTTSDKFFADGSDADHMLTVGGQSGLYVLSNAEWTYLLSTRGTGDSKFKIGVTVNGVANCLVIAPDGYNGTIALEYTEEEWTNAESDGLVCLPAAGGRNGSQMSSAGFIGTYWSATPHGSDEDRAYNMYFNSNALQLSNQLTRNNGCSVRLVCTVSE